MRRREFIRTVANAAVAWPFAALAQQQPVPVVGFVHTASPADASDFVAAFRQGLKETGLVEGQNVAVEFRWAERNHDRLPELYADLVRRQVTVIVAAGGEPSPQVAKAATQTIPIVFTAKNDPVRQGLVASLNQPGGNVTGITIFGAAAVAKRMQLLREVVPQTATLAYLVNPNNPNHGIELRAAETAAHSLGMEMFVINAGSEREIDTAFATMDQHRAGALLVASDTFFFGRRDQLSSLAARHRIPAIYYLREFAQAGGLITYGNSVPDMYRQVGIYTGRILKGEKPADLPVQQASKFDLVINLKTAKTLGLTVPFGLLNSADEVIE
jgi:putative tryptophan/tyrosine transport system substrate-binding protein